MADPALDTDIAPMTYYEQGTGAWRTTQHWVGSDRVARAYRLSGNAGNGGTPARLTTGTARTAPPTSCPVPVAGLCTRSANQWTAGIIDADPAGQPVLHRQPRQRHSPAWSSDRRR